MNEFIDAAAEVNCLDLFDTSSSSSEEMEADSENRMNMQRKSKKFYYHNNCQHLDSEEFEKRFRMPRGKVEELASQLSEQLQYPDNRNYPVSPYQQLLIALRYYATGSFQIVLADCFGVSQPTASRVVARVSRAIAGLSKECIKFPSTEAGLRESKMHFYEVAGIPHTIGVIDGTHIPIQSPGGPRAEIFRNRKGFFSINTQVVCDATMKVVDIVARWPGSSHDQSIFNFSQLRIRLEDGEFGDSIILGDSGYCCKNYLITPLSNPQSLAEQRFQKALISTRILVERTIGVWKRRFPVIGIKNRLRVDNTVVVIVATAVLHNMLRDRPVPISEVGINVAENVEQDVPLSRNNDFSRRNQIILNYFN